MKDRAMMALLSRVCTLIVPLTVGAAVLFSGSTELRGDDVPSLQKENGPYMVLARTFRGPDAVKFAKALALELRQEYKLPAYLYDWTPKGDDRLGASVVLVGNAKTLKESESILKQVKAISPRCLADMPNPGQRSLARAYRTPNPLAPARRPIK